MTQAEAVTTITEKVILLESSRELKSDLLAFYVEKLTGDILDYCHRTVEDFPDNLVYTVVDLIRKRLADEDSSSNDFAGIRGPLNKIKQDDTEFGFAVANVDATGCLSDLDFNSIKPKLNLYRKVVSWA